jgi:hypothetical protein
MILSLSEVAEFKKAVTERFSVKVHFCDSCGGQSFTVESPTDDLKKFVVAFFDAKNLQVIFSGNGELFTVKRKS